MATPIPGFASQFIATDETVQVASGTLQAVAKTRWYYFVSNRIAQSNGQSLLKAIKDLLDASLAGTVWTVVLTKVGPVYKIQVSHNNGSSRTFTLSTNLATALGFATAAVVVASGVTVTADYPSFLWWTPNMPISLTGPIQFDPSISYGIAESAGFSQRSPDMTETHVRSGEQWSAEYTFNGVEFLYVVFPQVGYTNRDLQTWWRNGPQKGRRFLMWRSRDNATGSNAPSEGSASPYNYIEYAPQGTLRGTFPAVATSPPNLYLWDVKLDCWVTPTGEAPLTD